MAHTFNDRFLGKRVLVTGHTGFKGSWLTQWLLQLGAEVTGFSLAEPVSSPNLFDGLGLSGQIDDRRGDIRDPDPIAACIRKTQPDFVFHLAAQSLVRKSYSTPVETYAANVMGTVHVLDALRRVDRPVVGVMVTTDKCYENKEWLHGYREEDPMGGYDPYSSSKGAAEIAISAFRRSFFSPESGKRIASARAGNVIGGGDWALDRIIPDCIRSLQQEQAIPVRNKVATRPWQHVLEPLSGYLQLASALASDSKRDANLWGAFNFGPGLTSNRTVADVVEQVLKAWPGAWEDQSDPDAVHEAKLLNLSTDKAYHLLAWRPVWDFEKTIAETTAWYRTNFEGGDMKAFTQAQIARYTQDASGAGIPWSTAV